MYETDSSDIDLIETEYELIDEADAPDPNKWQSYVLSLEEMDCASGVCWHAGTKQKRPVPKKPNQEQYLSVVLRDVASWFVPAVVGIAMLTCIVWAIWGPEPSIVYALVNFVAVLIIACPCAFESDHEK